MYINAKNRCSLTVIKTTFCGGGGGSLNFTEAALPPAAAAFSFVRGKEWSARWMAEGRRRTWVRGGCARALVCERSGR